MNDSVEFKDLLEEYWVDNIGANNGIIEAEVIEIKKDKIVVDAKLKSSYSISKSEFKDDENEIELNVGDKVKVYLETIDDGYGETRLSREKAKEKETWEKLEIALEEGTILKGKVLYKMKGGFHVNVNGLRVFLPGSLAMRPTGEADYQLEGEEIEFKVLQLDKEKNNVLISRKAIFETEIQDMRKKALEKIKEGDIVTGIVKNTVDYGAFVGIGGVDGLLYVSDMSWRRIKRTEEVVQIGQEIKVKVLKIDHEKNRLSLGIKQITEDPWIGIEDRFKVGDVVKSTVTNMIQYGCFAEIADGVEGLIHVSEMSWTNKNIKPGKMVEVDQEVDVMILDLDAENKRLSLGMKQCADNPWKQFSEDHKVGDKITGTVNAITSFGLFVSLEDSEIDGLVHNSDIDWSSSNEAPKKHKKGDKIDVVVMAIDVKKCRISLGIKQLVEDPFEIFKKKFTINEEATGKVKTITHNKLIVTVDGIDVVVKKNSYNEGEISKLSENGEATIHIIGYDNKYSRASGDFEADHKQQAQFIQEPAEKMTLGNLIKEQMDKNK